MCTRMPILLLQPGKAVRSLAPVSPEGRTDGQRGAQNPSLSSAAQFPLLSSPPTPNFSLCRRREGIRAEGGSEASIKYLGGRKRRAKRKAVKRLFRVSRERRKVPFSIPSPSPLPTGSAAKRPFLEKEERCTVSQKKKKKKGNPKIQFPRYTRKGGHGSERGKSAPTAKCFCREEKRREEESFFPGHFIK